MRSKKHSSFYSLLDVFVSFSGAFINILILEGEVGCIVKPFAVFRIQNPDEQGQKRYQHYNWNVWTVDVVAHY